MSISTPLLRIALWITVPANFAVAGLLLVPGSALGQLAGLPPAAPAFYALMVSIFVALFGAMYVWLALQPQIHKPLLVLATAGKTLAFAGTAGLWLMGLASGQLASLFVGDLLLAGVFASWLWQHRHEAP